MSKKFSTLIGSSESTTIEWKQSLSEIDKITETVAAFANTEGGRIFIGVSPEGKAVGVQIGKGTIEKLVNQIAQNIDLKVHPKVTMKKIDGKEVLVVRVSLFRCGNLQRSVFIGYRRFESKAFSIIRQKGTRPRYWRDQLDQRYFDAA